MDSKYLHFTVREWGLIRETKLPMQELELKVQGAYARGGGGGGIIAGFYGNSTCLFQSIQLIIVGVAIGGLPVRMLSL